MITAVHGNQQEMKLEKFLPSPALSPFIKEFMIIESDYETTNKTLPGTSLVMSLRYKGAVLRGEGTLPAGVISGLRKSPRLYRYTKNTGNLITVFTEGGLAAFSRIPAHELFEQSITAENLFRASELERLLQQLSAAKSNLRRIQHMEHFLLQKSGNHLPDQRIISAIRLIQQQKGVMRIKELAASLYMSQDPFEKKFRVVVGATAKQYASIIRLRSLVTHYSSGISSLTDASYEAGYFDQSHFIKDFRAFTGQSPKEFFRSPSFW